MLWAKPLRSQEKHTLPCVPLLLWQDLTQRTALVTKLKSKPITRNSRETVHQTPVEDSKTDFIGATAVEERDFI